MALTFNRELDITYGRLDEVVPGIRRVVANNPGPYTYKGTATFVIGTGEVAVIDPGPADEAHIDAIMQALGGERVSHILVTHTHPDHSPGAAMLKERTGAPTYGFGPHPADDQELVDLGKAASEKRKAREAEERARKGEAEPETAPTSEEHGDTDFHPDVMVGHEDEIRGERWRVEALHTPGHIANHLCFALPEERVLFTGDHVMGWSTSVISPPGGDLVDYLASLALLLPRSDRVYVPTHGAPISDPHPFVEGLIAHRNSRSAQIIEQLQHSPQTITELVRTLYIGLDERLIKAAGRSVLAHLVALANLGDVVPFGKSAWVEDDATFHLARE